MKKWRAKRKAKREHKKERRASRRQHRLNKRAQKYADKQARRNARNERAFGRQETRRFKRESKTNQNIAAYANGIDPKASMWQGIASLGQSASSAITSFSPSATLSASNNPFSGLFNKKKADGSNDNTMLYVVIAGVVAFILFFKPSR